MKSIYLFCVALLLITGTTQAQLPRTLTVQGVLTDNMSLPISDGIHKITIHVYDRIEGGTPLFTEEFTTPIFKGLFNISIGSKTPLPSTLTFDRPYFIGVSYDDKAESSRIVLSSVPYAIMAATVPDGSITAEKLSPALRLSVKGDKTLANTVSGAYAFIGGGNNNVITNGNYASIVGGNTNTITTTGTNGAIGGGFSNALSANSATIAGGYDNTNSGSYGSISGGYLNSNSGQYGSIGGGYSNNTTASYSTISGGNDNSASGQYSSVGGGSGNSASGSYTTIAGGLSNSATGLYTAIPGGRNLSINSASSFGFNGGSAMTIPTDSSGTAVFANTNLWLANNDNTAREIRFFEPQNSTGAFPASTINYTAFKAGVQSGNIVYTLPTVAPTAGQVLSSTADGVLSWITGGGGGGGGTVTNVSVTTANGVSGSVANSTTTPAITLTLGAITPTSVAASGMVTGSNLSGTNTGDQIISDATLTTTDITTNNFTTAKHGFVPKGTNVGNFLRDDGTWAAPSGSGDMLLAGVQSVTGAKTFESGKLILAGATSGTIILNAFATAGSTTITLPATSGTVALLSDITGTNSGINTGDQDLSGLMVRSNNLSDVSNVSTARTNLGLGTLATQNGTFSGTSSGTNTGDQDLSGLMVKANNLNDLTNASTARTNLGLGTLATQNGTFSGTSSGTNTGDQTITLTGDVTGSGTGSFSTTIAANAVTYGKMQTMTANKLLGSGQSGTAVTEITIGSGLTFTGNTLSSTSSGGSVTSASVTSANGFAGSVANATTTPEITISTSVNGMAKGNGTALSAATSGTDYSAGTASLGTGILKSTTGSGALTIAVAADFPTLNQNTTGNAATVTTNANLTGPVTSVGNATSIANGAITNAMLANSAVANLTGTNSGDQVISDATITTTDITTNNFTTAKHGFVPKGTNVGNFLRDDGTWAAPSGSGDMLLAGTQTVTGTKTFNSNRLVLAGSTSGTTTFNAAAAAGTTTITLPASSGTVALVTDITDVNLSTSDNTTNNVSTSKHGFAPKLPGNTTTFLRGDGTFAVPSGGGGGGSVTSVSVSSANGFGGSVATATTTPAISITTSVNGIAKGNGTALSAATVGTDYSAGTSALSTGILKSTNGTGALTIAVAADFPTLNQNTTGNAATVTTNANLTGPVTSVGNATSIANGAITNAMLANSAVANLSGTNTGDQVISDATITTTNITTNNVSTTKHGFAPRLPGNTTTFLRGDGTWASPSGGGGTVTSVSVTNVNGVSGTVATATTTPAISISLGDITPNSVTSSGAITGSNLSGTNTGDQDLSNYLLNSNNLSELTSASTARTNLGLGTLATQSGTFSGTSSGTNTGDQTITLTGNVTGTGTGSFVATIANNAVTYAKMQTMNTQKLLGSGATGTAVKEVMLGPGIAFFAGPVIDTLNTTALVLRYVRDTINVLAPNDVIHNVRLQPQSNSNDIDFSLTPKGNGALTSVIADNSTVGGNKRGQNSVDWQILRAVNSQVASGNQAVISGGASNTSSGPQSTVGGGFQNTASLDQATIAGGALNTASAIYTSIGGGSTNTASATGTTVSGGISNTASAEGATIGGGSTNVASGSGTYAFIGGGSGNTATAERASISGGLSNTVSGDFSAIPGGRGLTLSGSGSFGFLGNNSAGTSNMTVSANNTAVFGNVDMWLTNNDATAHELRIYEESGSGSNYTAFKAGAQTGDVTYTFPSSGASVNRQTLVANTDGQQRWAPLLISSVASSTVTISPDDGVSTDLSLELMAKGNGEVRMDANIWLRNGKEIRFYEVGNGNYSSYKAGTQSVDINYTIPTAPATANRQPLIVNTDGTQSWSSLVIGSIASSELSLSPDDGATSDLSLRLNAKGSGEVRAYSPVAVRSANELRFYESDNSNYSAIKADPQAGNVTYTLPTAAPTSDGQMMTSTSGGAMSWKYAPQVGSIDIGDVNNGTSTSNPTGIVSSATKTSGSGASTITITIPNQGGTNYIPILTLEGFSGTESNDTDLEQPVIRNKTSTSFDVYLLERTGDVQNLRLNVMIMRY